MKIVHQTETLHKNVNRLSRLKAAEEKKVQGSKYNTDIIETSVFITGVFSISQDLQTKIIKALLQDITLGRIYRNLLSKISSENTETLLITMEAF